MTTSFKKALMIAFAGITATTGGCSQVNGILPENAPAVDTAKSSELIAQQDTAVTFVKCTNSYTGEVLGSGVARGAVVAEGSRFGVDTLTYTDYATGQTVAIEGRLRNAFTCNVQGVQLRSVAGGQEAIIADTTEFVAVDAAGRTIAADTTSSDGVSFSVSRYTDQLDWQRHATGNNVSPAFVRGGVTITARGAGFNS